MPNAAKQNQNQLSKHGVLENTFRCYHLVTTACVKTLTYPMLCQHSFRVLPVSTSNSSNSGPWPLMNNVDPTGAGVPASSGGMCWIGLQPPRISFAF